MSALRGTACWCRVLCLGPPPPPPHCAAPGHKKRTGKEGEKALRAAVDDVNLVQADSVHHLLALLQLALGRGHKLGLRAHGVKVARARKGPPNHRDLARGLVNGDDVAVVGRGQKRRRETGRRNVRPRLQPPLVQGENSKGGNEDAARQGLPGADFLLGERLNHLGTKLVDRLHLDRLERQLANLLPLKMGRREAANEQGVERGGDHIGGQKLRLARNGAPTEPVAGRSIFTSTTSPSIISVSSLSEGKQD